MIRLSNGAYIAPQHVVALSRDSNGPADRRWIIYVTLVNGAQHLMYATEQARDSALSRLAKEITLALA